MCCQVDNYSKWAGQPHILHWRKEDFNYELWDRYCYEEYGPLGRSRTKFDCAWVILRVIGWIILCGVCCGFAAIRLFIAEEGETQAIGDVPFTAVLVLIGFSAGTFVMILYIIIKEVRFCCNLCRSNEGPFEFIADNNGFVWMNDFNLTSPGCANNALLEAKRTNHYRGLRHPCIEICFSRTGRYGSKSYFFHRIPIPPNRMHEAEQFAPSTASRHFCWKQQEGYALDLENNTLTV